MRRHGDEENFAEAQEKGYLAAQKTTVNPFTSEWRLYRLLLTLTLAFLLAAP